MISDNSYCLERIKGNMMLCHQNKLMIQKQQKGSGFAFLPKDKPTKIR